MTDANLWPATGRLREALLAAWPEHARFLEQSFARRDAALLASTERSAAAILRIVPAGELTAFCGDYRFLCDRLMEEEIHFRRHGAYRLIRFADAETEVYSNRTFMRRYMNFLLLTYVLWENHARALAHFEAVYLAGLASGARHLEIGPGHGLLLHLAAQSPRVASATGWDISAASIEQTRDCLRTLGGDGRVTLAERDLYAAPLEGEQFDSVVMSEVLEHLEDPVGALVSVARHMRPGAALWIHVPVNSPAPDHIYLLRTPEDAVELVRRAGFEPVDTAFYPMTGQSLERARKHAFTISVVIAARRVR